MQRHAWAFWGGESLDPETQRHHLASVVFHAMALMEYEAKEKGTDDRSVVTSAPVTAAGFPVCCKCGYAEASIIHRKGNYHYEHDFVG